MAVLRWVATLCACLLLIGCQNLLPGPFDSPLITTSPLASPTTQKAQATAAPAIQVGVKAKFIIDRPVHPGDTIVRGSAPSGDYGCRGECHHDESGIRNDQSRRRWTVRVEGASPTSRNSHRHLPDGWSGRIDDRPLLPGTRAAESPDGDLLPRYGPRQTLMETALATNVCHAASTGVRVARSTHQAVRVGY